MAKEETPDVGLGLGEVHVTIVAEPGGVRATLTKFLAGAGVRAAIAFVGLIGAAAMLLSFVLPVIPISLAPWKLTELTARVGAGWGMLTALTVVSIAYDGRWSAARILVESGIIGPALMLLALPRAANDLNWSNPTAWLFVGALSAALVFFIVIHLWLDRESKAVRQAT